MAEIKLIALDLDGTLLDSQKRLSSRNERVFGLEYRSLFAVFREFVMRLLPTELLWKISLNQEFWMKES